MKASLKIILNAGSILLILILIAIASIVYNSFQSLQKKGYWVVHTNKVLTVSNQLFSALKDVQIGQRGFIITSDSTYLQPYLSNVDSISIYIRQLRQLTSGNTKQQARMDSLQVIADHAVQLQKYAIMLKASQQTRPLEKFYDLKEGQLKMNKVKAFIQEIIRNENVLLKQRSAELDHSIQITKITAFGIIAFCGIIISILFLVVRQQLNKRDEDALQLNVLNESLNEVNQELMTYNEELNANREELFVTVEQLELIKKELEQRVEERTANLKESNEKLAAEAAEHKHTAKELEKRNHELDNYVYKVSHDLRAPLTSILGLMNLIQSETNPDTIRQYTNLIGNRALKLDDFIKSILNHSKTINSAIQISEISFQRIINECVEELKYLPAWDKIKISMSIQAETVFYSDELRITILFKNFISNAIKYHNPAITNNYVNCRIQVTAQQAIIHIEDNGIGISEEYKDKIFNMFFRATASSDGSGLGLYIVKQTLEKLEGTIQVESVLNKGTTFFLQLPNFIYKAHTTKGNS